jgi:hypothetical protein
MRINIYKNTYSSVYPKKAAFAAFFLALPILAGLAKLAREDLI